MSRKSILSLLLIPILSVSFIMCSCNPSNDKGGDSSTSSGEASVSADLGSLYPTISSGDSSSSGGDSSSSSEESSSYPTDTGTLVDNIFEAEHAQFSGQSQNGSKTICDHACSGQSYFIDASLSNGVCLRNITSKNTTNTFTWTFTSSANLTVDVEVRVAAKYVSSSKTWPESNLSDAFSITNNGEAVNITGVKVPSSTKASRILVPGDTEGTTSYNNYANMVTTTITMKLYKGKNTLVFTPTQTTLDLDYINIKTSATISNYTKHPLGDAENILEVTTAPTKTTTGIIKVKCEHSGCTQVKPFLLPILSADNYTVNGNDYSITILDKTFTFTANA